MKRLTGLILLIMVVVAWIVVGKYQIDTTRNSKDNHNLSKTLEEKGSEIIIDTTRNNYGKVKWGDSYDTISKYYHNLNKTSEKNDGGVIWEDFTQKNPSETIKERVFTIANGQLVLVHVRYKDLGYLQTKLLIEKITSKYGAPSVLAAIFLKKASISSETIRWRTEDTDILLVAGAGSFPKLVVVNYYTGQPSPARSKKDVRFISYVNGTVLDTRTELMWAAKDNGEDINWKDAKRYCENYTGGEYLDWRMPSQDELMRLYEKNKTIGHGYNNYSMNGATELIKITSSWIWASETRDSEAARFLFGFGNQDWEPQSHSANLRALPVRSSKRNVLGLLTTAWFNFIRTWIYPKNGSGAWSCKRSQRPQASYPTCTRSCKQHSVSDRVKL